MRVQKIPFKTSYFLLKINVTQTNKQLGLVQKRQLDYCNQRSRVYSYVCVGLHTTGPFTPNKEQLALRKHAGNGA